MRNQTQTHAVVGLGKKILAAVSGGVLVLGLVGNLLFAHIQTAPSAGSPSQLELANSDDIKRG